MPKYETVWARAKARVVRLRRRVGSLLLFGIAVVVTLFTISVLVAPTAEACPQPPPPSPKLTVTLCDEANAKAAHVEKLSGPVTHWYKEPDGEPDDFPQVLEVDGVQEPNPVTIEASDYGQNWGTEGK